MGEDGTVGLSPAFVSRSGILEIIHDADGNPRSQFTPEDLGFDTNLSGSSVLKDEDEEDDDESTSMDDDVFDEESGRLATNFECNKFRERFLQRLRCVGALISCCEYGTLESLRHSDSSNGFSLQDAQVGG